MAGTILELGNGKYRFMVWVKSELDGKRMRKSKVIHAKSKREAERLLHFYVTECEQSITLNGSVITLEEFSKRWLKEHVYPDLSPVTAENYERELINRINPALGHHKLSELKPLHIIQFYNDLLIAPRRDKKEGVLSGRSRNNVHRILSSMLTDAVYWQMIPINPITNVRPPKQSKHKARFYNEEEAIKMLACLEGEEWKYKTAAYIAVMTGMRRGEILGLTWSDIDFEKKKINLERSSVYTCKEGVMEKDTKTHTTRTLSINNALVALLRRYRKEYIKQRLNIGELWNDTDRLMVQWNGKPMFPATLTHWFGEFLIRNNLPKITFHELRHTSATILIKNGVDVATVAKRLGHAQNTTTLNFYIHAIESTDKVASDTLASVLMKAE